MGAGKRNVVFFDFPTGEIIEVHHDVWDIAFSTTDETLPNIYKKGDKIARIMILPVGNFEFKFIT